MRRELRFAIVGAGNIAGTYEAVFAQMPALQLSAICDVHKIAAMKMAARSNAKVYVTVDALLRSESIDAAIVCTPPATHESIAIRLLECGVHVLCEKPLATSVPAAWRMLEASKRGGALLTMASKFRYVDDVRNAYSLVRAGGVGELVSVENSFTSRVDMHGRWNADPSVSGGGVLIDNGTHAVDILRYFLGNLRDIQVVEGRRLQGLPVEDTVRLFVHNDDGVMGTSDLSWSIDKALDTYVRVYGSEGTVLVGWQQSRYRRFDDGEWHTYGHGYDKLEAFKKQIANFAGTILGEEELDITQRDALASVEVIRAAYAALERARWERIGVHKEELDIPAAAGARSLEAI